MMGLGRGCLLKSFKVTDLVVLEKNLKVFFIIYGHSSDLSHITKFPQTNIVPFTHRCST